MSAALRFSANLSFLFREQPFLERFAAAAAAGFEAVEFHFPYDYPPATLTEVVLTSGVRPVLFNLPAGDWNAGERGIACHPDRVAEFREGVARAREYARALEVRRLNCLVGLAPAGVPADAATATLLANLRHAATQLARDGVELLIEALNTRDNPGYLLPTSRAVLAVIDAVAESNMKLQYDLYHAQIMEGDLARTLAELLPRIGHIQFADNPGRHEPGTGEIRFEFVFAQLRRLGYDRWIGAEYLPSGATADSFGWRAGWA